MAISLPQGFRFAGTHCGIKQDPQREDLTLVVSDRDCVAVGVYTQNQVVAAPVLLDRSRTPASHIRAVVANSGNANACTGTQGDTDAADMAKLAAQAIGCQADQVLVLSTGIIGEHLPMDCIAAGVAKAATDLGTTPDHVVRAARGLMTTDSRHKLADRVVSGRTTSNTLLGMAKGAAMIGPRMATMLSVIVTDAALPLDWAQQVLRAAVEDSFNCISVEGHMSTNDTVLLLANGAAENEPTAAELESLEKAIHEICVALARAIPQDGEGATHLIEIKVTGCRSRADAHRIARSVADSPLVKTAIAGADPNWGRIVSAAGYAGVPFTPTTVKLTVNGFRLFADGQPLPFDETEVSAAIRDQRDTHIHLDLGQGHHSVRFWTCDLTAEYVRLNADYHT